MIDIDKIRAETPGIQDIIHLNSAGAGLMPQAVHQAIVDHLDLEMRIGGYAAAEAITADLDLLYQTAGELLNCTAEEIAFTGSATDSYNRALSSIPFKPNDVILTTTNDYSSNQIAFLGLSKRYGVNIKKIKDTPTGEIDLDDLEVKLDQFNPRLLAITHIPTNSGLKQPIQEIGDIVSQFDTIYLIDACQTLGQFDLDTQMLHCDFLSATMRKFLRGPRGMGILYVSKEILDQGVEPLFLDMHGATWTEEFNYKPVDSALRFEDWEFSFALLQGCRVAIQYALDIGLDNISKRNAQLRNHTRSSIQIKLPGATILDRGKDLANLITIHIPGFDPVDLKHALLEKKINTSASLLGSGLLDFRAKEVPGALRISPHYYNIESEIDECIDALVKITNS